MIVLCDPKGRELDITITSDTRMRVHHSDLRRLVAKALASGAERLSLMRVRWDISGDCENGYSRLIYAAPPVERVTVLDLRAVWPDSKPFEWDRFAGNYRGFTNIDSRSGVIPYELELVTRCRVCDHCRTARTKLWRMRAAVEIKAAARTWFGTLTLRPENQYRFLLEARRRAALGCREFDELSDGEQFKARVAEISREITLYLKRVRKASNAPLRYCLVAEAHKSGDPHFHILIHERDENRPVTHRILSDQWPLGFTNFKLVDDVKPASYIAKYLSKSALARVRASKRYGSI